MTINYQVYDLIAYKEFNYMQNSQVLNSMYGLSRKINAAMAMINRPIDLLMHRAVVQLRKTNLVFVLRLQRWHRGTRRRW
jgi:hypothetical protein